MIGWRSGWLLICLMMPGALLAQDANAPYKSATLQVLDKVTARANTLEVLPNLPTSFGNIDIYVKTCWTAPRDEKPEQAALMEIIERKPGSVTTETIFAGWMFASSPALSALEHPIYDVTLIQCHK